MVAEENAVREVTGIRMVSHAARLVAAYQGGRQANLPPEVAAVENELMPSGDRMSFRWRASPPRCSTTASVATQGRLGGARAQTRDVAFLAHPGALRADRGRNQKWPTDLAQEALRTLSTWSSRARTGRRGIEARGRAMVAWAQLPSPGIRASIACLARTHCYPSWPASHLLYGEWLRRQGRRVASANRLGLAYDMFTAIGAEGFAERARSELLATGEKVRKRQVDTNNDLTSQEEHIARLARNGRSNAEIGAELFLSIRTVEWHIRKVFTKLGITSRRELKGALPSLGAPRHPHGNLQRTDHAVRRGLPDRPT